MRGAPFCQIYSFEHVGNILLALTARNNGRRYAGDRALFTTVSPGVPGRDTALIAFVSGFIPEAFLTSQISSAADFNFTPFVGAALCFLVVTIPMTRFTDWMLERQRRQRQVVAVA